ncbi:peptide chain release factor N(5)-glutamine methyltransferase [Nodosilinea sp. LEGE 07298]|uniref:peptide chain release factor N(5)-glutamine methyltransferase n=1 Tax=Nodosilinea sp. LEGE 07298 TaxID=2777970 RepID=UPI0018815884|nr:peptide chain release factor N(5)-glutamine methyltransferase [Nodosilinea sp. LEGE 07298]MBE9111875.1 peptide chain release factor N(5)-glutamine methyltransferase [Nodosilinea sp. LEGE 07298]
MTDDHSVTGHELWAWRESARQAAQTAGVEAREVDWLLLAVADVDGLALKLGTVQGRSQVAMRYPLAELDRRWQQRLTQRVPVQYLVGETPWRDLTLAVSPAVLIPRPETELMIDLAAAAIANSPIGDQLAAGVWVDMGTGSGAIALGLAQTFSAASILAVDLSAEALAIAVENATRVGLRDGQSPAHGGQRITFYHGSWFEPIETYRGQISAVVSNPPYIPSALLPALQPEVNHEPTAALDGGDDGLTALRILVTQAPNYLVAGGLWLVETMAGQGEIVRELLEAQGGYRDIHIWLDLAGRDRFVQAIYAPE